MSKIKIPNIKLQIIMGIIEEKAEMIVDRLYPLAAQNRRIVKQLVINTLQDREFQQLWEQAYLSLKGEISEDDEVFLYETYIKNRNISVVSDKCLKEFSRR